MLVLSLFTFIAIAPLGILGQCGPFCVNLEDHFQDATKLASKSKWDGDPNKAYWTSDFEPNNAKIDNGHLVLSMQLDQSKLAEGKKQGFGATVSSTRLMLYGNVSASIKSGSSSVGVVSSFITKNDQGDEIDYEWTDKVSQVQTNYYWNGQLDYTHSTTEELNTDLAAGYHLYEIQWMPEAINWVVDGVVRRTVTKESTFNATDKSYRFPARPSHIQLSIWDAAQIGSAWTDSWSGGRIDWTDPNRSFNMEFAWIKINCLDPAKDASWPPAGYGPTITDSTQSKIQGDQSNGNSNNQSGSVPGRASSNSSIVVPIALTGGLFGGMIIVGYALSVLARRKKASKVSPSAGKPEMVMKTEVLAA
ncbi:putative glycosidase CRH2 [Umbelopsis nana]